MYFKKLEIFGFKSFADKTSLTFQPGITAIVGPNGCGKSNIFDAIRWVLGEQSVKELRGASMEDVIFNGTDKKPPLGFADVSVTFSNESRTLPVDYNEVTVTRRLYRSGESEYLLNRTPVRLKDITELLMGTGIGAESYSLVQQGKVDLVVSSRPEDRRIILDEAAGITKYKSKKREALNKLKDTENNLLRINDIIVEVKRQISSIERQANKARRYKDEFEKLKNLEVRSANHEIGGLSQKRYDNKVLLEEFQTKEADFSREVEQLNELIEQESLFLEELEEKINEINSEDIKLDGQVDINNHQINFNDERIEGITVTENRIQEQKDLLIVQCRQQSQKIDEVKQSLSNLDEELNKNFDTLESQKKHLELLIKQIQESEASIRNEEEKILDITSKQVHFKNRLTEIMKEVQGGLARKRRLEVENTKVSHEKIEVDEKLSGILGKISIAKRRISQLQEDFSAKNTSLDDLTQQLNSLQDVIDDLEKKKLFLKSQKEFIEKLCVQYEDMPDPVVEGRLYLPAAPQQHQKGLIGKIKNVERVNQAPWRAGEMVHDALDENFYEITCETKFIELDPQQISSQIDQLSHEIGERIVLKQDLLSRLEEQRKILNQVRVDIHEQEKILSIFEAQENDIQGESYKLNEELELVKIELQEVTATLTKLKYDEDDLTQQLDILNQELNFCQIRIRDSQDIISGKGREREQTSVSIAQLETAIGSVEDKRKGYHDNLQLFSESMDKSLDDIKRIVEESEELNRKRCRYKEEIEKLRQNIDLLREQKQSLCGVLSENEKQKNEVSQKVNSVKANVQAYHDEVDEIRKKIHNQELLDQEILFHEKEIKDRLQQSYKIDLDAFNVEAVQAQSQEAGADSSGAAEKRVDEYSDPEALRIAIERLRKRCDSFGSVNLIAIEEFEELRERFEFLTKQQSDLITAKESLRLTINKINRQTRQMFMDTFTKVSEEFRIYFRMLFGGGEARLVLLDPENVLESGIEIIARPPGKKLQSISLLSGGEKTLTAIALIFGVFKVNPSPFCILDEIDAALDESNVGRFAYLLQDFAKIAQFIVITHNKKTIASVDAMYGITMEETGVSKIVSVRFGESESKEKAAPEEVAIGA